MAKKWNGEKPTTCDTCGRDLTVLSCFYDARIPQVGSWGLICHRCFTAYQCKLGTGRGQKYSVKTLEKMGG
jgi:rRNA maturation endonuclease Nob1